MAESKASEDILRRAKELDTLKLQLLRDLRKVQKDRIQLAIDADAAGVALREQPGYCCEAADVVPSENLPKETAF